MKKFKNFKELFIMDCQPRALPLPDIARMLQVERTVADLYHAQTSRLLPAIRERLEDLSQELKAGNDTLRKQVLAALISINELLAEEHDAGATSNDYEEEMLRTRMALEKCMIPVNDALGKVERYRMPDFISTREGLKQTLHVQLEAVKQLKARVGEEQQRLAELDELLALLAQPSVARALRNAIPEEKDIDTIVGAIKDPSLDAGLLKAGLQKINKNLDLLAEGRKFADLAHARSRLSEKIGDIQESLYDAEQQVSATEASLGQYSQLDEVDALRKQWSQQAGRFMDSWQTLEHSIAAQSKSKALREEFRRVQAYLVAVRRLIEAV
ncbi:alpha-xenorhabdolysin family binary toxin subunit B [Pseudomonas putida]